MSMQFCNIIPSFLINPHVRAGCVYYSFLINPHLLTFPPPPHSHSDGEPISEPPLVSVAAAPVEAQSVDSTLLSKLYQLVASQQVELQQLREEQQRSFVLLQQQLEEMRVSTVEQHRTSLTEHAREQRILHQDRAKPSPLHSGEGCPKMGIVFLSLK